MDFLDPKKKRAHRTRLFVGYALMTALISVVTLLLVFQAYGYNFNFQTGDITQNGLVFVDAHPEAATVLVNGQEKGQTDQRLIMPADNYTIELRRNGYRSWQRTFTLMGGKIERLVYPFMFPEQLVSREAQLFAAPPTFATQSPDRRWLITQQPNEIDQLNLTDLNSELANSVTLNLPNNLMSADGKKHKLAVVEWSTDNRHVVLRHNFDGKNEFVLIDREEPAESVNLSRTFSDASFTTMTLRDKRFDRYYLYDKETKRLQTANLESEAVTPLLDSVLDFHPHGEDVMLFVTTTGASQGRVLLRVRDDDQVYTLRDLPADSAYLLDVARFNGKWYMVGGAVKDQKVYVLRDPVDSLRKNPFLKLIPAATMRIEDAQHVSFSTNARFIAAQSGSRFAVYDAETDRNYRYDTKLKLTGKPKAEWMDGHRLTLVSDGKTNVFDFDGINKQVLSASYDGFIPYFDRDYTALYTLAESATVKGRATLLRTELIVDNE